MKDGDVTSPSLSNILRVIEKIYILLLPLLLFRFERLVELLGGALTVKMR